MKIQNTNRGTEFLKLCGYDNTKNGFPFKQTKSKENKKNIMIKGKQ